VRRNGALCSAYSQVRQDLWRFVLSTAWMHTLLMPSRSMLPLRCRPVGQTPIYDQLRGERINADVAPSTTALHAHSGRHRLDEETPSAAAVVARPSDPGAGGLVGHHRRVGTHAVAHLAGDELGADRAWGPRAAIAVEAPARAAPRHAGRPSAPAAGHALAAPAAAAGGGVHGHQAARAVRRVDPCPAAEREAAFSWFGGVRIP
jgi:hypothetical protein